MKFYALIETGLHSRLYLPYVTFWLCRLSHAGRPDEKRLTPAEQINSWRNFMHCRGLLIVVIVSVAQWPAAVNANDPLTKAAAARALRKGVDFFRQQVSANGGYLWRYSADLARREGEGKASATMAWVQPPGTPVVGAAFLNAYELTGDQYYLEVAGETAYALVNGQLRSGGWDYRIEFDPRQRRKYAYRVDAGSEDGRNATTFDDNTTQSALRYLMHIDKELDFQDKQIHEAVAYALASILKAQYPNGAWPQRYSEFPDAANYPVQQASYPDSWSRTWPKVDYRGYYTFNDNSMADVIAVMFEATEIYGDVKYRKAAEKAGDFIILAQMPQPQPGWAQQYDADMHPAWARRFEPPAITGGESRGVLRTLMFLYRQTGDKKYLEPIPRALEYYKQSELPGNRMARFYELKTNKPLYFTKKYELTYNDDDLPTHYGFITGVWVDGVEAEYRRVLRTDPNQLQPVKKKPNYRLTPAVAARAKAVVERMDKRGAWIEQGQLKYHGPDDSTRQIITTQAFVRNVGILSQFLAASN